jgi:hypothetical protein
MPQLPAVARHWQGLSDWPHYPGNIDSGEPFCARCGWRVPPHKAPVDEYGDPRRVSLAQLWQKAGRVVDRAHLVDHMFDGRDDVANIVPLCHLCHREMPSFGVREAGNALAWVKAGRDRGLFWQTTTDAYPGSLDRATLRDLWVIYLEARAGLGPRR